MTPAPTVLLTTTCNEPPMAVIAVDGQRYRYDFMTRLELDTLEYLFKVSELKALNYAKKHCEKWEKVA